MSKIPTVVKVVGSQNFVREGGRSSGGHRVIEALRQQLALNRCNLSVNHPGSRMTKEIEAIYEQGVIRPLQPLELPEGARLDLIVITHEEPKTNGNTAEMLAEIAALPLEGANDAFAGREHDSILYPEK